MKRFLDLHCAAIKWPLDRVTYIGIDPPPEVTPKRALDEGEAKALEAWKVDLYGVGHELSSKRVKRGWEPDSAEMATLLSIQSLEPVVKELVMYDGGSCGNAIFPKRLPWMSMAN